MVIQPVLAMRGASPRTRERNQHRGERNDALASDCEQLRSLQTSPLRVWMCVQRIDAIASRFGAVFAAQRIFFRLDERLCAVRCVGDVKADAEIAPVRYRSRGVADPTRTHSRYVVACVRVTRNARECRSAMPRPLFSARRIAFLCAGS